MNIEKNCQREKVSYSIVHPTLDPGTKSVRCNYGLCDLRTILFATKSDFHAHLQSDHGFDSDELEELGLV